MTKSPAPPAPVSSASASSSPTDDVARNNVIPSEVGWQFVPQYYTFVNKHPHRLHCFYTKSSTFIHGTEGEDGKPCFGQLEIHNKITSIGFEDCKVFIHSVDAQSSANGGIIIQVIGEMSNRGEPWRKFVQTFFLAEQPNGYYVLNDIFRFLKEETVEGDSEDEDTPAPVAAAVEPAPEAPAASPESAPASPAPQQNGHAAPTPAAAPAPIEKTPTPAPVAAPEPVVVVAAAVPEPTPSPAPVPAVAAAAAPAPAPAAAAPPQPQPAAAAPSPSPAPAAALPQPAAAAAPAPAPTSLPIPTPAAPAAPAPAPAPVPAAPPAPKTWAHLAAANSKKWGSAVAQESRGTSEVPATPTTPAAGAGAGAGAGGGYHGPGGRGGHHGPQGQREPHPAYVAAQNVATAQCFVKSVQENISDAALRNTLTARFGAIKELEIVRSKACAFLEFGTVEAARRAIAASLPQAQGGEGGVRIDVGEGMQMRVLVETRKERGERPVSGRGRGAMGGVGGGGGGLNGGERERGEQQREQQQRGGYGRGGAGVGGRGMGRGRGSGGAK
ncbi:hypothetical protein HETIRDRAFT_479306 [Heterobasidion irregulare TC 32-1]|uniref:NTF2 domain-containing protein n=1 Tax=Heterobasidion irregulare (strain TC 32-1) TaxID=747525 RepID=W4JXC8_HETIT|nr:uncharacterized protein HETIRDRAFT_479306 [Heterobasidion irregulare TC 32-1]ETW78114.1 hypothetical protein HETIRDRAFT_479306 [Heterobasidion irregulare TC 32-1]